MGVFPAEDIGRCWLNHGTYWKMLGYNEDTTLKVGMEGKHLKTMGV